jgi:PAS domain-containing protein
MPLYVSGKRPDGTPDYFNNRWLELTGKTQEQMQTIDWGEITHPNDQLQLERDANGTLHDLYFNFVYQQFRENGEPAGVMAFAFEVTDLGHARQALEKARGTSAQALDDAAGA